MKISSGIVSAAFLGLIASAASAQTLALFPGYSDPGGFQAAENAADFEVFNTRIRHGGSGWTHSARTNDGGVFGTNNGTNTAVRQNGNTVPFSISYNGSQLTMTVGGNTINDPATGNVTDLWFKATVANNSNLSSASVTISNLTLNGNGVGGASLMSSLGLGEEFFQMQGASFGTNFTVAGDLTLAWSGTGNPSGEGLKFEVVALSTIIPLPGAAGMALAGMGMIGLRRRR